MTLRIVFLDEDPAALKAARNRPAVKKANRAFAVCEYFNWPCKWTALHHPLVEANQDAFARAARS